MVDYDDGRDSNHVKEQRAPLPTVRGTAMGDFRHGLNRGGGPGGGYVGSVT